MTAAELMSLWDSVAVAAIRAGRPFNEAIDYADLIVKAHSTRLNDLNESVQNGSDTR